MAHTLGKEVIIVTQDRARKIPFDVGHVRYIRYSIPVTADFDIRLKRTIQFVLKESAQAQSQQATPRQARSRTGKSGSAISTIRKQRISELATWARENSEKLLLITYQKENSPYSTHTPSYWSVVESLKQAMILEATKRWSPTPSTAKDYADNAYLSVEGEFKPLFEQWVPKSREEQRKDQKRLERKILQINIDTFVNNSPEAERFLRKRAIEVMYYLQESLNRPVSTDAFVHEPTRSKQFKKESALKILDDMVQGKILQRTNSNWYEFSG